MAWPPPTFQVGRRRAGDEFGAGEATCDEVAVQLLLADRKYRHIEVFIHGLDRSGKRQLDADARVLLAEARQMAHELVYRKCRRREHAHDAAHLTRGCTGER